jgi:hypothetical protein
MSSLNLLKRCKTLGLSLKIFSSSIESRAISHPGSGHLRSLTFF